MNNPDTINYFYSESVWDGGGSRPEGRVVIPSGGGGGGGGGAERFFSFPPPPSSLNPSLGRALALLHESLSREGPPSPS